MKNNNIISQALSYYDKKKHKFKKLYDRKKYDFTINREDTAELPVCFFTRLPSKDTQIKANYNFLGMLHKNENLWVWGWSVIGYNLHSRVRTITYLTKQIMNYAFDLQTNVENRLYYVDNVQDINAHQRPQVLYIQILRDLLTSQFYINHPLHLEKILALSLYITNSDMIYVEHIEKYNINFYYIIQNIDDSAP